MTPTATIVVKVKPGAKAPGVVLTAQGAVEIRVRERAAEGKATRAALDALASALDIPPSTVTLLRGARSRIKMLRVDGLSADAVRLRLEHCSAAHGR